VRVHYFQTLLACALVLSARHACALVDLDAPFPTPSNPTAGEFVWVNVRGTECDLVDDGIVWPPPVTQQGDVITIVFTGIHEEDPEFCYFSSDLRTYPVGAYPAGAYTLQVDWRYGTFSGWVTQTLGVIPFTVIDAPTRELVEIPTLTGAGLGSALLILIATALRCLRSRSV
jgi:hypothetical protein